MQIGLGGARPNRGRREIQSEASCERCLLPQVWRVDCRVAARTLTQAWVWRAAWGVAIVAGFTYSVKTSAKLIPAYSVLGILELSEGPLGGDTEGIVAPPARSRAVAGELVREFRR